MITAPTDQEAIEAARRIKASIETQLQADRKERRRKNTWGWIIIILLFLLGVVIAVVSQSIWTVFYFYGVLVFFPLLFSSSSTHFHCGESADEEILICFAKSRNWYEDVWEESRHELRHVQGYEKRKRFYATPRLLSVGSIIRRIDHNDLAHRPVPPTGEVPRKKPIRSLLGQKLKEATQKREDSEKQPSGQTEAEGLHENEVSKPSEENLVESQQELPPPAPTEQSLPTLNPLAPEQPIGNPLKQGSNLKDANKPPPARTAPPARVIEADEGGRVLLKRYAPVRDPRMRAEAIAIHGNTCCICGFDFDKVYGEDLARGYIEVHHLKPVGNGERKTNAQTDLAPLCANCHAMADRLLTVELFPPESIEELKAVFESRKRVRQRGMNL